MKPFNTRIPDLLNPCGTNMLTQEYHMEPPVTGGRLFTRYGTYLQLIKRYAARDKQFLSTMPSWRGSYPTYIGIMYHSVTIHSATHGIYVHPYYCFRPEIDYSKLLCAGNDTITTKHYVPGKYSTMISEWENNIYTALSNEKIFPKYFYTQNFIIPNHYPSEYESFYSQISDNRPNNLTRPIYLISAHQNN